MNFIRKYWLVLLALLVLVIVVVSLVWQDKQTDPCQGVQQGAYLGSSVYVGEDCK